MNSSMISHNHLWGSSRETGSLAPIENIEWRRLVQWINYRSNDQQDQCSFCTIRNDVRSLAQAWYRCVWSTVRGKAEWKVHRLRWRARRHSQGRARSFPCSVCLPIIWKNDWNMHPIPVSKLLERDIVTLKDFVHILQMKMSLRTVSRWTLRRLKRTTV